MSIKPEYKTQLVDALLECHSVNDPNTRNALINELPNDIKNSFQRNPENRVEVVNLVTRCLDFQNGIEVLVNTVRVFESDSEPIRTVYGIIPLILEYDSPVQNKYISELLSLLPKINLPVEDLKSYFWASRPTFTNPSPHALTCWRIIEHLANFPLQTDRTHPILLFARNIADQLQTGELAEQLGNWIARVESDLEADGGKIEMTLKSCYRETNSDPIYLLVHLIPDPNNRNNKNQEFAVNIYAWRNPETDPRIYTNEKCEKSKILEVIDKVIDSKIDENDEIRAIEFILPCDWIHLEVDEWRRTEEFEWEPGLATDYQVVIRLDRYHYAGRRLGRHFRVRWKKQWDTFKKKIGQNYVDTSIHWVCNHEGYDARKVCSEFFNNDAKTWLVQTFLPQKPADFGETILNAGIPVALWRKKLGHKAKDHEKIKNEILQLIKDGNFSRLPDRIHNIYHKLEQEKILQDHLTLLWDDPERLPRDLKKRPVLKTP